ncbi:unnamed protein product, partial [Cyprideis torosa]
MWLKPRFGMAIIFRGNVFCVLASFLVGDDCGENFIYPGRAFDEMELGKDHVSIRDFKKNDRDVVLFGRNLTEIPCFRSSFLNGIGAGFVTGLATFLVTSRGRFSFRVGYCTFPAVTIGYFFVCRYQLDKKTAEISKIQQFMDHRMIVDGMVYDPVVERRLRLKKQTLPSTETLELPDSPIMPSSSDLEGLKPSIQKVVERYSDDDELFATVFKYMHRGYGEAKLAGDSSRHTTDSSNSQEKKKSAAPPAPMTFVSASKSESDSDVPLGARQPHAIPEPPKFSPTAAVPVKKSAPGQLSQEQIQAMMASAQRLIEERKRALTALKTGSDAPAPPASLPPPPTPALRAPLPPPALLTAAPRPIAPPTLAIDADIEKVKKLAALQANIRAMQKKEEPVVPEKPAAEEAAVALAEDAKSQYVDPRIVAKPAQRPDRRFAFHEKGKFEQQAKQMRMRAQLEKVQEEISQLAKKTGIETATKLAKTAAPKKREADPEADGPPEIEWWDLLMVNADTHEVDESRITNLVEHPAQVHPEGADANKIIVPKIFLTKKEQKKLRRQNRRETWKDKQEKIRLGLEPPPDPKVKLSNLMRVLGQQAVADPTKVEAHVRAQMAARMK